MDEQLVASNFILGTITNEELKCVIDGQRSRQKFAMRYSASNSRTIFTQLPGRWSMNRTTSDSSSFQGEASFQVVDESTLDYFEQGILRLQSGYSCEATRGYRYYLEDNKIRIDFANSPSNEGTFVILEPKQVGEKNIGVGSHLCIADRYDCTFTFETPTLITLEIEVQGPKKNYSMQTVLEKIDSYSFMIPN